MASSTAVGGRFDFDDGGTYGGGWQDGKAHGHGVCTGPKGQGAYCGAWTDGFETSGVYCWPTGCSYEGQWSEGRQNGLGVETRGRWVFRGEWTLGLKGRYGTRQSISSVAKYDGTWANGLQDGYGSETYADGGTFQGQWMKGMRHGYGVRSSAPFGLAAHTRRQSLRKSSPTPESDVTTLDRRPEEGRGGFVLRDSRGATLGRALNSPEPPKRSPFKNFLSKKRGGGGGDRVATIYEEDEDEGGTSDEGSANSFAVVEDEPIDSNVIETYMGEWKNDRRSGFGIAERSDGLKYEGEWHNNKKFGYGKTTYKDGVVEKGKYRHNALLSERRNLFRSPKFRERVEAAVNGAHRASQIALQKADIAISRTATARGKAEQADAVAKQARADAEIARLVARNFAPELQLPGLVQGSGFLKPKFPSTHDSSELLHRPPTAAEDKSLLFPDHNNYLSPEPPSGSAFLDLFRNNPDRRPSAAGFLRRPSTLLHLRRPSTVVEHSIVPSQFDQHHPAYLHHHQVHRYPEGSPHYQLDPYQQDPHLYHQHQQVYQVSLQQVIADHLHHYYQPAPAPSTTRKKPAVDLTELSKIYGIPLTRPLLMDEDDAPLVPQGRRSTLPTVIDQNFLAAPEEGMVRTGSLYTRKNVEAASAKAAVAGSSVAGARKKSLPDITNIPSSVGLTREAIAVLSSQRREAIRREEEEAIRLRQNPLLYLVSPEVWDWFASQQLVILIIVVNLALGFIFFNVIL